MKVFFIILLVLLTSCGLFQRKSEMTLESIYSGFDVEGAFVALHAKDSLKYFYNAELAQQAFSPASTFKIVHSIIALETGVLANISDTITWNGKKYQNEMWNATTDMKGAFTYSVVWYYQEVARRIGQKRMITWLDSLGYGKLKENFTLDSFWLNEQLTITAEQQVQFLHRLVTDQLPIKPSTYDALMKLMYNSDLSVKGNVYTKTGWAQKGEEDLGWMVGFEILPDDTIVFANFIRSSKKVQDFGRARIEPVKYYLSKF